MELKRLNKHCYVYTLASKTKPSKLSIMLQVLFFVGLYIALIWSCINALNN